MLAGAIVSLCPPVAWIGGVVVGTRQSYGIAGGVIVALICFGLLFYLPYHAQLPMVWALSINLPGLWVAGIVVNWQEYVRLVALESTTKKRPGGEDCSE